VNAEPIESRGEAPIDARLVVVTAPDGALHVLGLHAAGANGAAHVALGADATQAGTLGGAFAASRCTNDDDLADLVAHVLPLDAAAGARRVEFVHLGGAVLRPASLAGPFGERHECLHAQASAAFAARAWLCASERAPGGPWTVALGADDEADDGHANDADAASRLDRVRAVASAAAPFVPYRLVLANTDDDRLDVVDARAWCRVRLLQREGVR
jgi:hypothetical protein